MWIIPQVSVSGVDYSYQPKVAVDAPDHVANDLIKHNMAIAGTDPNGTAPIAQTAQLPAVGETAADVNPEGETATDETTDSETADADTADVNPVDEPSGAEPSATEPSNDAAPAAEKPAKPAKK